MRSRLRLLGLYVGGSLMLLGLAGILAVLIGWLWPSQPYLAGLPLGWWTTIVAWLIAIGIGFIQPISTSRFWHRLKTACRAIASSPAAQ